MLTNICTAQDIYLKVKKGSAKLNETLKYDSSPAFKIKNIDKVTVSNSSLVIATKTDQIFEVPPGNYSYDDINKLAGKRRKSNNGDLFNVIFTTSMQNSMLQSGSSTRGTERIPDFYSPSDDPILFVLEDSLLLEIGNKHTKILGDIEVSKTGETVFVYKGKPDNLKVLLTNLTEGEYKWSYSIKYPGVESSDFVNTFFIPSAADKKQMLKEYRQFTDYLLQLKSQNKFSEEMMTLLLEEYKMEKKIYTR